MFKKKIVQQNYQLKKQNGLVRLTKPASLNLRFLFQNMTSSPVRDRNF